MKDIKEKMNKHIEKYLNNYLKLDKSEFAVLLTGKWGSGKTYFIDEFIKNNETKADKQEKIKFIKISLFGLKELDAIDEQIFQNLHPIMGNKYVKLTGNIAKNALKLGIKFDWNDDGKSDGTSSTDFSKINLLDWFSDKKKSKEKLIFIFDDLERTDIELTEVLGYINYLVEQSEFNVIILANEEKIVDDKKEYTKYQEFKEKVIGKTFEVQHDFERILISFIRENTKKSKKYLNQNKSIIIDIYNKAGHHNLRHIKQILLDFEYFTKDIYKKYLDNKEFISILINNFFALSIEIKSGCLSEEELKSYNHLSSLINKDKEKSNVEKIYEKYNIKDTELFSGKDWVMVLFKSSISKKIINELFSKLSFFIKDKKKERPSWVRLWYYRELEDDEFEIVKNDVLEKFNNFKYETPQHFLHVIALLLFFRKKGLCKLSLEDIEKQVNQSIEKYKKTSTWKEKLFKSGLRFNDTGLGYMDDDSEEFRKFYKLVMDVNKQVYFENQKWIEKNTQDKLLYAIKNNNQEIIENILLDEYKGKPIFKDLPPSDFLNLLTNISNKNLTKFNHVMSSRYPDYHFVNNQPYNCYYFKEELQFWKNIDNDLTIYLDNNDSSKTLSIVRLKEFHEYTIKKLVEELENCDR